MKETREWIARVTGDAGPRQIAAALDVPNSTVYRWFREDATPAEAVVRIARLYGADPLEGLAAAEILYPNEAALDLGSLTTLRLIDELRRRELQRKDDVRPVAERARTGNDDSVGGRGRVLNTA